MTAKRQFKRLRALKHRAAVHWGARFGQRYLRETEAAGVDLDIGKFAYMGFGASIGWLQAAYLASDALQVPLYIRNPQLWPFGGRHPDCSMDRFIEFPHARMVDHRVPGTLPMESCDFSNLERWGYYDKAHWPTCLFGFVPEGFDELEAYRREVFARCYQPTTFAQQSIAPHLQFLPARYMAWHVRRGDKTSGIWREDDPVALPAYFDLAREIVRRDPQAPRDVVICTDDDAVIEHALAAPAVRDGELRIHYDTGEVRWNGYCALQRQGQIEDVQTMVAEVLTAQKVVEIFRRADYLVGCNSSCLFRVGALLNQDPERVFSLSENKVFRKFYPL